MNAMIPATIISILEAVGDWPTSSGEAIVSIMTCPMSSMTVTRMTVSAVSLEIL